MGNLLFLCNLQSEIISSAFENFLSVETEVARRHGSNTSVFQEALENVPTATIVLTSTLVVLEVTSVT